MQKPVMLMMIAAIMLAMPEFLNVAVDTVNAGVPVVATPGTLGSLNGKMAENMQSMMELLSGFAYICGIGFGLKAAFAFKEYNETGGYHHAPIQRKTDVNLEKKTEVKPTAKEIILQKPVVVRDILDFEDKVLNAKVESIKAKIKELHANKMLQSYEDKMIVDKTLTEYVPKAASAYVAIPDDLRKTVVNKKDSAHTIALKQLVLVEEGLDAIRYETLENGKNKLKVSHNFLKEKFASANKI